MTERDLVLRINRNANRRHEIYRKLEDPLIGTTGRELLTTELTRLEQDSDGLYQSLREERAKESHRVAVKERSHIRWPILSVQVDPPVVNTIPVVEVVAKRRRRWPVARPPLTGH